MSIPNINFLVLSHSLAFFSSRSPYTLLIRTPRSRPFIDMKSHLKNRENSLFTCFILISLAHAPCVCLTIHICHAHFNIFKIVNQVFHFVQPRWS
jgi:hypothetical protein